VLSALFERLQGVPDATVRRNEALPVSVPAGGLIILRDGDPGEPDVIHGADHHPGASGPGQEAPRCRRRRTEMDHRPPSWCSEHGREIPFAGMPCSAG